MAFHVDVLFREQAVDAHRVGRDGSRLPIDGQCDRFARPDQKGGDAGKGHGGDAYEDAQTPHDDDVLWCPTSCHRVFLRLPLLYRMPADVFPPRGCA